MIAAPFTKTVTLQRTGIAVPLHNGTPRFGELLKPKKIGQDLLEDILDYLDRADTADLEALLAAARKCQLLSPAIEQRIYFEILCHGDLPVVRDDSALTVLLRAYGDLLAAPREPAIKRLTGMILFGHWQNVSLDEAPPSLEAYLHRLALLKQCARYSHIPGMLTKLDKFAAFAGDQTARRIVAVLEALRYQHDNFSAAPHANYPYTNLQFWGLIEIALLNAGTRHALVAGFFRHQHTLPLLEKQLGILERYVDAVRDPLLTANFLPLRDQALAVLPPKIESAREAAVRELMADLGIAAAQGYWLINFTISSVPMNAWFLRRNTLRPEDLRLEVDIGAEGRWSVKLHRHDNLFSVSWDQRQAADVRAEQLKYRKLVKWPALASLQQVGTLIGDIEVALGVRFIRHANVASNAGMTCEQIVARHGAAIARWLFAGDATLGVHMRAPP